MELAFALFVLLFAVAVFVAPAAATAFLLTRWWARPWPARIAGAALGIAAAFGAFRFYYARIAPLWPIEQMDQEIYGPTTVYHDPFHPWGAWVLSVAAGAAAAWLAVQVVRLVAVLRRTSSRTGRGHYGGGPGRHRAEAPSG
jgi:hypothetical protein